MNSSFAPTPLSRAHGAPPATGILRARPEDFAVEEELGYALSGAGEHVWLKVRKCEMNTPDVARALARHAGVRERDVSYAGLKDRGAVTTQWFSIHSPGKREIDFSPLDSAALRIIEVTRHARKLQRGGLRGNRFEIIVRDVEGDNAAVEQRLREIAARGAPNYFGEQRFGRENLARAHAMLVEGEEVRDRFRRGIYLSALRSELFNRVLARRVEARMWDRAFPGEALMLQGSHSFFVADALDETLARRLAEQDIHPTGPLWGAGESPARGEALEFEQNVLCDARPWRAALEKAGLGMERRALRVKVENPVWEWLPQHALRLRFGLPAGCYATAVVGEVADWREA